MLTRDTSLEVRQGPRLGLAIGCLHFSVSCLPQGEQPPPSQAVPTITSSISNYGLSSLKFSWKLHQAALSAIVITVMGSHYNTWESSKRENFRFYGQIQETGPGSTLESELFDDSGANSLLFHTITMTRYGVDGTVTVLPKPSLLSPLGTPNPTWLDVIFHCVCSF